MAGSVRLRWGWWPLALWVAGCSGPAPAAGERSTIAAGEAPMHPVEVTLIPDSSTVISGAAIHVTIAVTNRSDGGIAMAAPRLNRPRVSYRAQPVGEAGAVISITEREPRASGVRSPDLQVRPTLPGEALSYRDEIQQHADAPLAPGRWTVVVRAEVEGAFYESAPAALEVIAPVIEGFGCLPSGTGGVLRTAFIHRAPEGAALFVRASDHDDGARGVAHRWGTAEGGGGIAVSVAPAMGRHCWIGWLGDGRLYSAVGSEHDWQGGGPHGLDLDAPRLLAAALQPERHRAEFLVVGGRDGATVLQPMLVELTAEGSEAALPAALALPTTDGPLPVARWRQEDRGLRVQIVWAAPGGNGARLWVQDAAAAAPAEGEARALGAVPGELLDVWAEAWGWKESGAVLALSREGAAGPVTAWRIPLAGDGAPESRPIGAPPLAAGEVVGRWRVGWDPVDARPVVLVATDRRLWAFGQGAERWAVLEDAGPIFDVRFCLNADEPWAVWAGPSGVRHHKLTERVPVQPPNAPAPRPVDPPEPQPQPRPAPQPRRG